MTTSTYGVFNEFHPESEPISAYIERVSNYYATNEIPADKQVSVLLTVIEPKIYALLRSLTAPTLPNTKSLDFLVDVMRLI